MARRPPKQVSRSNRIGARGNIACILLACVYRLHVTFQVGWINGIEFAKSGRFAVLAVGQEHRFGRWVRVAEARNGLCLVNLNLEHAMQ